MASLGWEGLTVLSGNEACSIKKRRKSGGLYGITYIYISG
jgi:hypothetical protein